MTPYYIDAARWDQLWSTHTPDQLLQRLQGDQDAHPDWHARVVACLNALQRPADALSHAERAIEHLQGRPGMDLELLRAMRLLTIGQAKGYQQVIDEASQPLGSSARRMEASLHTNYVLSISYTNTARPYQGLMHLGRAQAMAFALDLPHRSRVLTIEGARNAIECGEQVDLPKLRQAVESSTHDATVHWGHSIVAELLTYSGDYPAALRYARQHGLTDLACMLQALNLEFDTPDDCDQAADPYSFYQTTARGIRAAARGLYKDIPSVATSHHALTTYGRFLNAQRAMYSGDGGNFAALVGSEPHQPDQRVYWAASHVMGCLVGLMTGDVGAYMEQLARYLLLVPHPGPVMRVLEALSPRIALLLARHPDPRVSALAAGIQTPLLMDGYIAGRVRIQIHHPTCEMLIARALGQKIILNTGFISKAREKARAQGVDWDRLITAGDLFVMIGKLALTDSRWAQTAVQLVDLVPALKSVLESGIEME